MGGDGKIRKRWAHPMRPAFHLVEESPDDPIEDRPSFEPTARAPLPHPIVSEELYLLKEVSELLREMTGPMTPSETPIVRELERIREQIVSGSDRKDIGALTQQWHRQSSLLRQLRASRDAPIVDPLTPYFAHLRLREADAERDLCLGRATCVERGVRIVDWRNAPISRIFYRYRQGEEFEENLAGRLRTGEVVARRTVHIRDGILERVEAPEGIFTPDADDAGSWQRVERARPRLSGGEASAIRAYIADGGERRRLGTHLSGERRRVDKHLPEITSLIDPEQFDLITRPSSGFLAIRGTAGSGKTTVALHRIAYLAYGDRTIDSERTLFVVFSPALRSFVSHVLPALGVEHVRILTYHEWAANQRRRHFPNLPAAASDDLPASIQRLKLHPALCAALERQVKRVPGAATAQQAFDDWASVLTQAGLLEEVFEDEAPGEVTNDEIRRFVESNRRSHEALYAHLAGEPEVQAELDPEDDTLLLRAWQLRVGPLRWRGRRPLRYRHVAIDEVQDFSPLEVQVLLHCLDPNRSITLAGDTQQHVVEESGFTSWRDFLGRLGIPGTEIETLRVAYRSSHEIVAFSLSLLGDLREEEEAPTTTRSGPPVELFRFTDRGACVAFLADALLELLREEPLASVAILTPSPAASALYHQGLVATELSGVRLVTRQDFTFAPGIEVTEIEQVKGLEFDYVILVDVTHENYPDAPESRRLLHVGATRAVHQLWLLCVGTPSPLLGDLETV
jgi:DNA helicase-2/ATP-dependent DNA helicase PcrA